MRITALAPLSMACPMVGDGTDDTLGVGDVLVGIKRDIEVDLSSEC